MDLHVFPFPIPPPASHSNPSLQCFIAIPNIFETFSYFLAQ